MPPYLFSTYNTKCQLLLSYLTYAFVGRTKNNPKLVVSVYSFDTYQFNDYGRYDAAMLPEDRKARVRETQFPQDLQKAYELGKRLATEAKQG